MQLSDDGSADEVEQTPATLPALLGADATGRRMSPQVQRLLSASRGKLGAIGALYLMKWRHLEMGRRPVAALSR
jgi:hypothetical protein